jgi:hypothetical protein
MNIYVYHIQGILTFIPWNMFSIATIMIWNTLALLVHFSFFGCTHLVCCWGQCHFGSHAPIWICTQKNIWFYCTWRTYFIMHVMMIITTYNKKRNGNTWNCTCKLEVVVRAKWKIGTNNEWMIGPYLHLCKENARLHGRDGRHFTLTLFACG